MLTFDIDQPPPERLLVLDVEDPKTNDLEAGTEAGVSSDSIEGNTGGGSFESTLAALNMVKPDMMAANED